ncbi:MAG: flagellar basal body protein [Candidatus Kapaibacterium sp.]
MVKEIYTAALGMIPQQTRLEMTASNIANANSVGYKRVAVFEQSLIEARLQAIQEQLQEDVTRKKDLLSSIEDTDVAKTIMNMNKEEMAL